MQIHIENADREFAAFVDSLGTDMIQSGRCQSGRCQSGRWLCAHIHDPDRFSTGADAQTKLTNRAILDFYLQNIDLNTHSRLKGHIFVRSLRDIYLMIEDIALRQLESLAYDISDIFMECHSLSLCVEIFDLSDQARINQDIGSFIHRPLLSQALLTSFRDQDGNIARGGASYTATQQNTQQNTGTSPDTPAKVLLVEDDKTTRSLVKAAMEDNCKMITAPDASRGLAAFLTMDPDLVLLDISLPDGNGQEMLDFMIWHNPNANVVMFSAQDDRHSVSRALSHGARGFLPKPFVKKEALKHLNQHIRLQG